MLNVLVIGDLMLDKYINGDVDSISPEAPIPILKIRNTHFNLGGACNVANNLLDLGANVSIYGVIGDDENGRLLESMLQNRGINAVCKISSRPTTTKTRIVSNKHQMIRIDNESTCDVEDDILDSILNDIKFKIHNFKCIILSDYLKGVLTFEFTKKLILFANSKNIPVLCDPKGNDFRKYKNCMLITPNKKEILIATNIKITDDKTILEALHKLREICNVTYPLITLSEDGIAFLESSILFKKPTIAKEVYDVSGAGDTVIAALAIALMKGKNIHEATLFANKAAAIVVSKAGSATATLKEIQDAKNDFKKTREKIFSKNEFIKNINYFKFNKKKIIFTNGCFDILHSGHVKYLEKARELGDVLIVGLNSDSSIRNLKGDLRPINLEEDRASVLASLGFVDYVVIFEEDTPKELVSILKPDILVKGKDYENKPISGSEFAKEVVLIDLVKGKSSSNIIEKIKNTN